MEKINCKNLKIYIRKGTALLTAYMIASSLTGCMEKELAVVEKYDTISQTTTRDGDLVSTEIVQELDVEGENFKLITKYRCNPNADNPNNKAWLITSDKELYITAYTQGLPEDYSVYIDNVHIDTSILSDFASMNGIKQDSMDDRIHNSVLLGFYIDDETPYFGVNIIEGMNQEFIQGTMAGYNGYSTGSITQKRFLESEYREAGVWGSKISIAYDLLIKGSNDKDYRNVTVYSTLVVEASPYEKQMGTAEDAKVKRLEKIK